MGEKKALPKSHGEAIKEIQEVYVPLMAEISIVSGDPEGNLSALLKAVAGGAKFCEHCGSQIYRSPDGNYGHKADCTLLSQAREVLQSDGRERERREITAQQEQLQEKLVLNQRRLDSLAARQGEK